MDQPGASPANDTTAVEKTDPERQTDPRIARALAAMQGALDRRWTVGGLAKIAGMSRAAFARRFLADTGAPPLRHLAAMRLAHGARMLIASSASIAEASREVGYVSEFAFARAFKRHFGEAPGVYRRRARAGAIVLRAVA